MNLVKDFFKYFFTIYGILILLFVDIKVSPQIPRYQISDKFLTAQVYYQFPLFTREMFDLTNYPSPLRKIKIAVFDTGVDFSHPLLREFASPHQSMDAVNDLHGHGTHVAGIIVQNLLQSFGAQASSYFEIRSFNYYNKKKIYEAQHPRSDVIAPPYLDSLKEAIDWEPDFLNISTTGNEPSQDEDLLIIKGILLKNIVIIAAAGNEGQDRKAYPCAYLGVICVGSNANFIGTRHYGSNYGDHVQVFAKGYNVASTLPVKGSEEGTWSGSLTGTSQATPQVTALFAIEKISSLGGKEIRKTMTFKSELLLLNHRNIASEK